MWEKASICTHQTCDSEYSTHEDSVGWKKCPSTVKLFCRESYGRSPVKKKYASKQVSEGYCNYLPVSTERYSETDTT